MKKGEYKTTCGLRAFVARIESIGVNSWQAAGTIEGEDGAFYLHRWDIYGESITGREEFKLVVE